MVNNTSNQSSHFRLSPLCYSVLSLLFMSVPATAAELQDNADSEPSTTLDTIVVTANPLYAIDPSEDNDLYNANVATVGTKIPDYLENIPQSISVITQAKIDDLNLDTLDQIAKRTTGLRVLQNDDGRSSIYSRGYEYDQYSIDGLASPMASINGTLPNLAAFDRVEVMRGPSGLFNSASEMGGVVNLVRKRGKADGDQILEANVSNPTGYGVSADLQGSLSADDSLVGRTVLQYNQRANPVVDDIGGKDNQNSTVYVSADKQLNENSKFGFGYLMQDRQITPDNGLPTFADKSLISLPRDDFYGAKWNDFNSQSHDVFADFEHRLASAGVISAGMRYSDREADYNYAFAGGALEDNKTSVAGIGADIHETSLSADVNLSQPFKIGNHQSEYVIGADYKRFKTDNENARTKALGQGLTVGQINDLNEVSIIEQARRGEKGFALAHTENTLSETGLYGKVNYKPIDKLSLIVGGRLSHYEIESDDKISNADASTDSSSKATGYGAAVYELTPNINAYGSYTQVFTPQYVANQDGELLKPREGDQIEIGLKGHWQDTLSARLSGYRLTDENAAAPTADGDQVALGKRQMQGVEVEVNGEIMPNLQVSGGYSYLDSDIKQASSDRDDGIFLLMPKHSANLWVSYKADNLLARPLTMGLGVNAVGEFSSSQGIKADSYNTWDAMVSYPFNEQLTGQLNVYNLFNKDHYVRVGSLNTFNIPGDEREVKASLSYKF
ncbi:TonB-dependent siderophore receptor [Psychrobacter sp. AOP22-C1-22]|uniref:TonB-dependent siderophore receptor n=3 Tax=Moraxellaceae TaxID=468 RepID=UPI0017888C83|nr:TonB-dependent siderophore receptor [Psychrobacter sp. FME6]MBE0406486.1 TonB-dependent siderophore receptor [Psychrobacter sp. FME6]MDN5802496.1 TonB-dependent siderophore receptor [Psychrobacter sp.]